MTPIKEVMAVALETQIESLQELIEEMRLEQIPDVEQIRNIQINLDNMREALNKLRAEAGPEHVA